MAIATTYNTGTASVNAGETAVTGQGTTWLTSGLRAGDLFWAAGFVVRIAAVNSNTSITLAYAWPGANRPAMAYEIRYTPDSERVLASTREMLTALAANALSPLVGLTPAANKGLVYTGAATASLFDLSPFARTLLDDADAAAFWTTLGATAPADKAFRRGNIFGTVTLPVGGVPTGALVERGENANGFYRRYADGLQICINRMESIDVNVAHGSLYRSADLTWTFPAAFQGGSPNQEQVWVGGRVWGETAAGVGASYNSGASGTVRAYSAISATARTISMIAIGRWSSY